MNSYIMVMLMTFLPFLELRASIPYGILVLDLPWLPVLIVSIVANFMLGLVLYPLIDKIIFIIRKLRFLDRIYSSYIARTQKKIHSLVEKYGELGVAVFIGIPLPMSGVYSGALAAYIIGLEYKKFIIASILGVIAAGIAVTLVVLSGSSAFALFIKM